MKIQFIGAAREVTGSKHLLTINGKKILLDCGMFQGKRREAYLKNLSFPFHPNEIDAVILSHAHIDHSGSLPTLVKQGFTGPIFTTFATRDLCNYMLLDSAFVQEKDSEYLNERFRKKGIPPSPTGEQVMEPMYSAQDVKKTLGQFYAVGYERAFVVTEGVVCSFYDAGHILGSSLVHLIIYDKQKDKRFTFAFTGDLGRKGLPLLRDPQILPETNYLITESTYGNRFHKNIANVGEDLATIINKTAERGGKIIIPAFALERTQEIVYHLNLLWQEKKIPEIPIYVDSPLSGNLTEVFVNHPECFDEETYEEFLKERKNPFGFGKLNYITSVEESKTLNEKKGPMIIISASGMCEFGRVVHHLRNNIEDPKTSILIVGFQAKNTLGRKILEKQPVVNILGEPYKLKAEVYVMDAFSAHADQKDLIDYLSQVQGLKKIFLVHGEEEQGTTFQNLLKEKGYPETYFPASLDEFELE